jgi:hypothetical protein
MTINTAQIQNLLRPGLAAVFGSDPMYPAQWPEIFEEHQSDKQVELDVEMKMMGLGGIRAEGAPTEFQDMGQRYVTQYINRYISAGFVITRAAIKDNLYKAEFPKQAQSLKNSLDQTTEVLGASILNNGFSSSFPGGDGVSLFSTSHPIDNGLVANTFSTQADLNETSLEQALSGVQAFQDVAGLRVSVQAQKMIVGRDLQWTANRILNSQFRTGTSNNDISAVYNANAVPQGYRVNQFLTDTNAWYVLTNAQQGLKYFNREPYETSMFTDFSTDNLMAKAIKRFSFGWSNFRAAWGSSGST